MFLFCLKCSLSLIFYSLLGSSFAGKNREELSFKDFFDGGGKALVFCKVLVRNFGCSEDFGFLPAWMSPNSTMATVSDVRGVYQLTLKIVAAIKKMDKIWT